MNYAIYLRKSRADLEQEKQGIDTLKRHHDTLTELAKKLGLNIIKIYKEIVSGETIANRIEMQNLLNDVEKGLYKGVLVMEIERLARGDTIDQGIVAQTFKYTNTKIITPTKTYDPNNEFDEEYFEFGLFMSRREFKTITRRLQRGRLLSVNEGKYLGSVSPYGYKKKKLEKGYTLEINKEESKVIKLMFDLALEGKGCSIIAHHLNKLGIKPPKAEIWTSSAVRSKLQNEVYMGKIAWDKRKEQKQIKNGDVKKTRPRNNNYTIVNGLHSAIVDEKKWHRVQELTRSRNNSSVRKDMTIKNPLASIVKCGVCGRNMIRRPYNSGYEDTLMCPLPHCTNVSSLLSLVEKEIIKKLKKYVKGLEMKNINYPIESKTQDNSLELLNKEIEKINKQINKTYELLEQGIYDNKIFLNRNKKLKNKLEELTQQKEQLTKTSKIVDVKKIPILKKVLDKYDILKAEEKNELLKNMVDEVVYYKAKGGRKYMDDFTLDIHTKI